MLILPPVVSVAAIILNLIHKLKLIDARQFAGLLSQVEALETERIKSDSGRVYLIVQGPITKTLTPQHTMKRENI